MHQCRSCQSRPRQRCRGSSRRSLWAIALTSEHRRGDSDGRLRGGLLFKDAEMKLSGRALPLSILCTRLSSGKPRNLVLLDPFRPGASWTQGPSLAGAFSLRQWGAMR